MSGDDAKKSTPTIHRLNKVAPISHVDKTDERQSLIGSVIYSVSDGNLTYDDEGYLTKRHYGATENRSDKSMKRSNGGLFYFATCTDYILLTIGTLCSVIHGAGVPAMSIVFGSMTNVFLNVTPGDDESTKSIDFEEQILASCLKYMYIGIAMLITSYGQIAAFEAACERQVHRIREKYYKAVMRQQIVWFDKRQSGEMASRLNDDMERVREGLGDKFSMFVQFGSAFLAGYVVGFIYNWQLTLVMLALSPIMVATGAWVAKVVATRTLQEQERYAIAGGIAEQALTCIRTVLAFNGQWTEINKYKAALEESRRSGLVKYFIMAMGMFITFLTTFSAYALAFWYGSILILRDPQFPKGTVFTVFFAVMNGSFALGNALPHLNSIAMAHGASRTIIDVLNTTPKIDSYSPNGKSIDNVTGKITFKNVKFAYPLRKDVQILKGLSFDVAPGTNLAVVGASGCGKSTIVNLLLRFYDVMSGKITIDDVDIRRLNVAYLRRLFGIVSQEPVLFDGTLEENIRLGNEDASHKEIEEALSIANAADFVKSLPDGLQTRVGERGAQLSGGQKQRIAIARALISNPKILLFDEATSALDSHSESSVQEALNQAQQGRTTITIAHRLSTIKDADDIIVLKDGEIIERGSYHDLMSKENHFYEMVKSQALNKGQTDGSLPDDTATTLTPPRSATLTSQRHSSVRPKSVGAKLRRVSIASAASASLAVVPGIRMEPIADLDYQPEPTDDNLKPVTMKKMFFYNRQNWPWFVLGLTGNLISGSVMPAFALFYSQIFAVYAEPPDQLKSDAIFWSLMFVLLGLINGIGFFIAANSLGRAGESMVLNMRLNSFTNLLRLHIAYFDDDRHSTGSICTRFATDGPNVRYVFTRLPTVVSSAFTIIAGIVLAFIFGWRLALVLFIMIPLLIASSYIEFYMHYGKMSKDAESLEAAGRTVAESVGNIRTVQALTAENHFHVTYLRQLAEPYRKNMRMLHIYGAAFGFAQSVPFFLYAVGFAYGGYLITIGLMQPINVFRTFFAIAFCGTAFGQVSSFIPDIVKARLSAAQLFRFIETPSHIDPMNMKGLKPDVTGDIRFNNVHFSYPTRSQTTVLNGLTLHVPKGQTVALVGPSGCGKSTSFALLERFYDPNRGAVALDNIDIRDINVAHLRSQMGLVSQEPVLFEGSIRDNILYGTQDLSHEQVKIAAEQAHIHDFIMSLPLGYETPVGEKGAQLSGGQKQRIAIARALIRQPKILLLDEATSALDTESEHIVQAALDEARTGRTCVMIAHRLSSIQNADKIVVIKDGQAVEQGTHQELLEQKGIYAHLCETQNLS